MVLPTEITSYFKMLLLNHYVNLSKYFLAITILTKEAKLFNNFHRKPAAVVIE